MTSPSHITKGALSVTRRSFLSLMAGAAAMGSTTLAFATSADAAEIAPGGTLRYGFIGDGAFGGLEPHKPSGDGAVAILLSSNVIETLARRANDGSLQMVLADSIVADDETAVKWTIHLKKGVLFHDGREMTADDVIFSLKRIGEPGTFGGGALGPVSKIESSDPYTVKLELGAPRSWLTDGISTIWCGIVPVGFDPAKPLGTGPFKLGQVDLKQSITLEKFDKYHGAAALVDQVVIMPFADSSAQINALISGQLDLISGIDASLVEQIEEDKALAVHSVVSGSFSPIQMRTDVAPFNDVRVRQALRLVMDRETVVNSAYNGHATVANDLYSPFDPDFDRSLKRTRDVEKAKALIEEAGIAGQELELVMLEDLATGLVLSENAKEIGLTINVTKLELAAFYGEGYMDRPFFGGDRYPSLPFFMISSMSDAPKSSLDQIRWRDKDYLDLWTQASATVDAAKKTELLKKMQEILFDRGAWIIPAYLNELAAYSKKIGGLATDDTTGFSVYRSLSRIGFVA